VIDSEDAAATAPCSHPVPSQQHKTKINNPIQVDLSAVEASTFRRRRLFIILVAREERVRNFCWLRIENQALSLGEFHLLIHLILYSVWHLD